MDVVSLCFLCCHFPFQLTIQSLDLRILLYMLQLQRFVVSLSCIPHNFLPILPVELLLHIPYVLVGSFDGTYDLL